MNILLQLKKILMPVSKNEDIARREFVFNILLAGVIILSFAAFLINLVDLIRGLSPIVPAWIILIILIFFLSLFILARKGHVSLASSVFCAAFFVLNSHTAFTFGVDIPASLLTYALIVVMAGVLIGTRQAIIIAVVTIATISVLGYLQTQTGLILDSYWRNSLFNPQDIVIFSVLFFIIATVSWLSNREIEKSLHRARASEAELIKERDLLELKVEERTREIKEMQLENMKQLYRFAEFGKISSGLFHDLASPLTAASLNMELVKSETPHQEAATAHVNNALSATRKMESFIATVRKQISQQETKEYFSVTSEILQVVQILSFKAAKVGVSVTFNQKEDIVMYGNNIKFSQIILNLVNNAIDSYDKATSHKSVIISLSKSDSKILCTVQDFGHGIKPEHLAKIFEPFFTTKDSSHGMGIGLSLVKGIVEKDFQGTIDVVSDGKGTTFALAFPVSHGYSKTEQSDRKRDSVFGARATK